MLSREEKAYCRGLEALKQRDFALAGKEFEACGELHGSSKGFRIVAEATRLLVVLAEEKQRLEKFKMTIKEASGHGKETVVRGQGIEKETR